MFWSALNPILQKKIWFFFWFFWKKKNGPLPFFIFTKKVLVKYPSCFRLIFYTPRGDTTDKIILADGKTIVIIGSTEKVRIEAHGSKCELNFIVLSNNVIPILLGVDWFCKTHATLNVEKQELMFNTKLQVNVNEVYRSKRTNE